MDIGTIAERAPDTAAQAAQTETQDVIRPRKNGTPDPLQQPTHEPAPHRRPLRSRPRRALGFADFIGNDIMAQPFASLSYGRVLYEGAFYIVLPQHGATLVDLDELCMASASWNCQTRYGTFGRPTWYGALDPATAIAEHCHRVLTHRVRGASESVPAALYQLHVRGRFADLHGRETAQPEIIADDYRPTQALAREARARMLGGVLYPSARSSGTCLAVFGRKVMRSARFVDAIPIVRVASDTIRVRPPWTGTWWTLHHDDLRRMPVERREYA